MRTYTFVSPLFSFRFFSALVLPLGPCWYHLGLILEPLGFQKRRKSSNNVPNAPPGAQKISGCRPGAFWTVLLSHLCTLWRTRFALLCSLFASSLLFFLFLARFGTILSSVWSSWDLKNIAFSLRGSSNSSLSLFSLSTSPGDKKVTPKRSKLPPQDLQKVLQRSLGALRSATGASKNHTQSALRGHVGVQSVSWGGFGRLLGLSCQERSWAPLGYLLEGLGG